MADDGSRRPRTAGAPLMWQVSSKLPAPLSAGRRNAGLPPSHSPRQPAPPKYDGPARIWSNPSREPDFASQLTRSSVSNQRKAQAADAWASQLKVADSARLVASTTHEGIPFGHSYGNKSNKPATAGAGQTRKKMNGAGVGARRDVSSAAAYIRDDDWLDNVHNTEEFDPRIDALKREIETLKNQVLQESGKAAAERDRLEAARKDVARYKSLHQKTLKQMEEKELQYSMAENAEKVLQRGNMSLEKFFELAARSTNNENHRGFVTLGGQFLNGGTAIQSTAKVTIDSLSSRPHTAYSGRKTVPHTPPEGFRPNTTAKPPQPFSQRPPKAEHSSSSISAAESQKALPQPRFWGTGTVEHYSLDRLRAALSALGDPDNNNEDIVRTEKEMEVLQARQELTDEKKKNEDLWDRAIMMVGELFGHNLDPLATKEEIVKVFEERLAHKIKADSCTIYFVHRMTNEITATTKLSKKRVKLEPFTSIVGAVQKSRRAVVIFDNTKQHQQDIGYLNKLMECDRMSCLAVPCFDDHQRLIAVVEISTAVRTVHFTKTDRQLLEMASLLLSETLQRTKVARELRLAKQVSDTMIECVQTLASSNFINQINYIADCCRNLIEAEQSFVWLLDRAVDELYVNTNEEEHAHTCSAGSGPVGSVVYSRLLDNMWYDDQGFAQLCCPIIDRHDDCIGVLEFRGKALGEFGEQRKFVLQDEKLVMAFSTILANYIEHAQYVKTVKQQLGQFKKAGNTAFEAISQSAATTSGAAHQLALAEQSAVQGITERTDKLIKTLGGVTGL